MARKRTVDRRARSQYSSLRRVVVYGFLIGLCLTALFTSLGGKFGFPQQATMEVLGPVQSLFSRFTFGVRRIKNDYFALIDIRNENKLLKAEIARQNEIIGQFREGYTRYLQLEEQLDFKKANAPPFTVSARIVGKDPSFYFKTIIVDRGGNDGVTEGMVARTPDGVVGQIIHTSNNYSKILLANAPSSAIDAMVQKNRVRGILKGGDAKGYTLHYVLKNADVQVGDVITTAGISGVFETGVPLGIVSAVRKKRRGMFLEVEVKPSVDFLRIESVMISVSKRQLVEREMFQTQ